MDENKNTQLFMGLCTSLVTQAWMQLGKIKNPMTDNLSRNNNKEWNFVYMVLQ